MFFILFNHNFKKENLINLFNKSLILKGYKTLKYFFNTSIVDREISYTSLHDVKDYPQLEGTWCFVPVGFISLVSYPSIGLEYGVSPDITPLVTLKVIANQWYWVFELETKVSPGIIEGDDLFFFYQSNLYNLYQETYGDSEAFYAGLSKMDNFQVLKREIELNLRNEDPNFFRLLTVDNKIVLPVNTPIKLIVTSVDVLHSFALPHLSVKIDAVPGRLSEQIIIIEKPGAY